MMVIGGDGKAVFCFCDVYMPKVVGVGIIVIFIGCGTRLDTFIITPQIDGNDKQLCTIWGRVMNALGGAVGDGQTVDKFGVSPCNVGQ